MANVKISDLPSAAPMTGIELIEVKQGAGSFSYQPSAVGWSLLAAANAAALRSVLGLGDSATKSVGTAAGTVAAGDHTHAALYQPLDAELTTLAGLSSVANLSALAGLTGAADKGIQFTGAGTCATYTLTTAGKALLDDADDAAQRTTLGLGSIATQAADSVNIDGGNIDGAAIGANTASSGAFTTVSATEAMGYATGAGGTVTQTTSKSTGATLNTLCGTVTMHNAALAAATTVSFTLTNSAIALGDVLVLNQQAGTAGSYLLQARSAAGSASIAVRNISAGSLSEAVGISFAVLKAVTA